MNFIGNYAETVTSCLNEFPGLLRASFDKSAKSGFRLVNRAAARIYIGGGDDGCNFIVKLVRSEVVKPLRERGVGVLVVDKASNKKLKAALVDGKSLVEKLQELGVELVTIKKLLSFYKEKKQPVDDLKGFYSAIDKIHFLTHNSPKSGHITPEKINDVAEIAKRTLISESLKYLIPKYLYERNIFDAVAVMDLDTNAPLVPQNIAVDQLNEKHNILTLSFYSSDENDRYVPYIIDGRGFSRLIEYYNPQEENIEGSYFKSVIPITFKREYSFFEVNKERADHYADNEFNCFYKPFYKDRTWLVDENKTISSDAEKVLVRQVKLNEIKENDFHGLSVVFIACKDKSYGLIDNHIGVAYNKAEFYEILLGQHNECVKSAETSEMIKQLKALGSETITVCHFNSHNQEGIYPTGIYSTEVCQDIMKKNPDTMGIYFTSINELILGRKSDFLGDFQKIISSPCSQWNESSTIGRNQWDIDNTGKPEVIVKCIRKENPPLTEEQAISRGLLTPTEAASNYLMHFTGGAVCGAVSYIMDEVADKAVLRQCPKVRPVYNFGRNVLFGGLAFGSLQTAFSHFSNWYSPQEPGQRSAGSWQQSVIKFCMNNALLLVPVTQGAVLPALCSMAGAMSTQVALQSLSQRLMTSEKGKCSKTTGKNAKQ
ncbi:hypothetical protein [Endozoicomonas sp.]|uniref:hypothetical protein n=1 Tax=Endozoicomonas sp. TaxID=1892382 RepID=UPI0028852B33|nr:hypothetical protein [Endozoicomonas sp.]